MSDHEVTQKEYSEVESSYVGTPPYGVGDNYPANFVSWCDALVYCNKRSKAEGLSGKVNIGTVEKDPNFLSY
jgi:formylglycine-generating enzyme required for sulfatase activity